MFLVTRYIAKYIRNRYLHFAGLVLMGVIIIEIIVRGLFTPLRLLALTISLSVFFSLLISTRKEFFK